jgi:hypothetical protein
MGGGVGSMKEGHKGGREERNNWSGLFAQQEDRQPQLQSQQLPTISGSVLSDKIFQKAQNLLFNVRVSHFQTLSTNLNVYKKSLLF